MKTNKRKLIGMGIIAAVLISTSIVVSAAYNQAPALNANHATTKSVNQDSPLDMLFNGLSSESTRGNTTVFSSMSLRAKGKTNFRNGENTPLDLLFNVTSSVLPEIKTDHSVKGSTPVNTGIDKKAAHAAKGNTPLDLLFDGVASPSADEVMAI